MTAYINGLSCISPQKTFAEGGFLEDPVNHETDYLSCIEPPYREHIDSILARRLSRYIKMGVTSALTALKDAGCEMPEAIITGTGLGSTGDNEKILNAMHENQERMINPTHFIQSTHNTISSQIAIMLKCHHYNSTYVHRGFSFESALFDGMLLFSEGKAKTALVGGVDAMTEGHYVNYARLNKWKKNTAGSLSMIGQKGRGVIPGEGSAHFLLASSPCVNSYACIKGIEMIFKPENAGTIIDRCNRMLLVNSIQRENIDLLITGDNGDASEDAFYEEFRQLLFAQTPRGFYKHLCGEYDTASGFALWLAANIIKKQRVPSIVANMQQVPEIKNLLIYSHYRKDHHNLLLLQRI